MNQMVRLGNNEVLKTFTFVDAGTNANAEGCSGELKKVKKKKKKKNPYLPYLFFSNMLPKTHIIF